MIRCAADNPGNLFSLGRDLRKEGVGVERRSILIFPLLEKERLELRDNRPINLDGGISLILARRFIALPRTAEALRLVGLAEIDAASDGRRAVHDQYFTMIPVVQRIIPLCAERIDGVEFDNL